jgi:hypothetical protein
MAQLPVRQPDWIDTAPIVVGQERRVLAPASAVWKHIADHESWPEWFEGLKQIEVTGEAEGVGGQRVATVPGAKVGEVFTAWEPDRQFAFAVVSGPPVLAAMAESVVIEATDSGCIVTYTMGIEPARGFGWLMRLGRKRISKMVAKALDALAVRAEAEPEPNPDTDTD